MTTSNSSTVDSPANTCYRGMCGGGSRGKWRGTHIAAIVLGFVFFWPVGLALLVWVASGRDIRDLPEAARQLYARVSGKLPRPGARVGATTDNVIFNEYQQAEFDRIREIREEIADRRRRFAEFRESARRRADQDEFDRFMHDSPNGRPA